MTPNGIVRRKRRPSIWKDSVMTAQLADKGHPALQSVSADGFGKVLDEMGKNAKPSSRLLKLIAEGRKSLQER